MLAHAVCRPRFFYPVVIRIISAFWRVHRNRRSAKKSMPELTGDALCVPYTAGKVPGRDTVPGVGLSVCGGRPMWRRVCLALSRGRIEQLH